MKHNKSFPLILIMLIISLFSCGNDESKQIIKKNETIKSRTTDFEKRIRWTNELEMTRMTKDYSTVNNVSSSVQLTPDVMALINSSQKKIYPNYSQNFSLDNSKLTEEQKKIIQNFCEAFSKNPYSGPEKYFEKDFVFNYVFFFQSFQNMNIIDNELKDKYTNKNKSQNKSKEQITDQEESQDGIFDSWKIGKPDYSKDLINIPVRFFYKGGRIDVIIELSSESKKILNISYK